MVEMIRVDEELNEILKRCPKGMTYSKYIVEYVRTAQKCMFGECDVDE